jgi:uncharacterized lipoprotein NlpE involved in copper resistance
MRYLLLVLVAAALGGCQPEQATDRTPGPSAAPAPAPVVDMHTSRDALDWAGTYEAMLACADCAGVHTRLTLERDGSFELFSRRLARDAAPSTAQGMFDWEPGGSVIVLDTEAGAQRFAVGEGRLLRLESDQVQPAWNRAGAVLPRVPATVHSTGQGLGQILEDHRWKLANAVDANNQLLEALYPDPERAFTFEFAGPRLHVQGGCNGLRGTFLVDADAMFEVTGAMSTMMACPAPLMAADAALAALLDEPLETVLVHGDEPTLVLLATTGEALVLAGERTLAARYGTPTRLFLEVAARTVACADSPRGDGQCLQVRERTFDEQGLLVGAPSEWLPFNAEIEGYQHEPGIRNVLRVDRFQPPAGPGGQARPVYVLDLVVESEVVAD